MGASETLLESSKCVHLGTDSQELDTHNNPQELDTRLIRPSATTLDAEQDVSPPREDELVSNTDDPNVDEPHQSPGFGVSGEPVNSMTPVLKTNSPYIPDCDSAAAQTEGRFSHEDLINVCPHGTRLPVHEHRYRKKICPDGTKEVTSVTLVYCAACPRPSIKIDFVSTLCSLPKTIN